MSTKGWIYKLQSFISLSHSLSPLTENKALAVLAQELVYTGGILRVQPSLFIVDVNTLSIGYAGHITIVAVQI